MKALVSVLVVAGLLAGDVQGAQVEAHAALRVVRPGPEQVDLGVVGQVLGRNHWRET